MVSDKPTEKSADLILFGGNIVSCDENNSIYCAIAIKDEKIIGLGSNSEVLLFKGENTECLDLNGKMVIPGLIDSHVHFSDSALTELNGEVYIPTSVKEALSYIKEKVKHIGKGEWINLRNTYPTRLEEYRFPTIEELDMVAPENPVFVNGYYAAQVNSCVLEIMNLDENSVVSPGMLCKDDTSGKLNGLLFNCFNIVAPYLPSTEYTEADIINAIKILQKCYNKLGITSVIDGGIPSSTQAGRAKHLNAYNQLYFEGELNIRVVHTCVEKKVEEVSANISHFQNSIITPPEWGKLNFLKVQLDGGILTGTSFMRKPYGDKWKQFGITDAEFCGIVTLDEDQLVDFTKKASELGLQMNAHCTGNASVDRLLSAYEVVNNISPIIDKRFSIIHANFTDYDTLMKIKELGIVLHTQPAWHYKDGSILEKMLDDSVMSTFLPYHEMDELGVRVCAGSDHMVKHDSVLSQNPYNPFIGMYNLVTRKTIHDDIIRPSQKITREQALKKYTIDGAYASFDENIKGSLEIGKLADLAVLTKDFFTCPEEDILHIESELTIVGGRIVYEN